jgi:type IV pilus assembly protein PilM
VGWRTSVGLDVGSYGVYVAEISDTRRGTELVNFGGLALPAGAVEHGEVMDVDAVAATIRDLFEAAAIRGQRIHVGIGNRRVVVRQVDLLDTEEEGIAAGVRSALQEDVPIPLEDAELGHLEVEELTSEDGVSVSRVLLVAAEREMVAAHAEAASRAGLRPVGVDLGALADLRCALLDPEAARETQMLVDVGSAVTDILVHDRGVPRFVRIVALGADSVTEAVTDEITAAVRATLGYHRATPSSTPVERVLVTGGGSKLGGLVHGLEDALDVPVERVRPLAHLRSVDTGHGPENLAMVEPLLVTAIGLALRGSRARGLRIDLLPIEYQQRERERRIRTLAAATGLALIAVPAGLYALRIVARRRAGSGGGRRASIGWPRHHERRDLGSPALPHRR